MLNWYCVVKKVVGNGGKVEKLEPSPILAEFAPQKHLAFNF